VPTFELSANGKIFEIDAPDQGAAVGAFQKMNGGAAPAALPQPSITDAVTDIPAEIGRTFSSNLDTFKEGANRGTKGPIEGLMSTGKAALAIPGMIASPVTGALRSLIGHPMAQAEHAVGSLIAPEIAAKDDPQKMYQTAAGDVETALSAARPGMARPPVAPVPTVPELKAAARAGYNDPAVAAVEVRQQPVANLSTQIENELATRGFRNRPNQGRPVFEEIRDLVPPQGVASVRVADLHSARKALGQIEKERDTVGQPTSNSAAATIAKRHLDEFLPNIQQADVLAGDAAQASAIMREADANWGAAKRAENVDLQLTRADRQAAKAGMGGNVENAMRQKISSILDNPKRTVGFSDSERQAMESIVRGTRTRNALRVGGKMGVSGGLSGQLAAAAAYGTGGASIPATAVGTIARLLGQRLTAAEGQRLSEMVRSRSPVARGNVGTTAVTHALTRQMPSARSAILYSAIVGALMQPQNQRVR
jgi:hypothetical protein